MSELKSVEQILEERGFSPVDKLLDLYDELEEDKLNLQQRLEENPEWVGVLNPIDNQKLRERVLTGVTKIRQTEQGHAIKLLEIEQKNPEDKNKGRQGIILQHHKRTLPDGRVVIEKVESIEQEEG